LNNNNFIVSARKYRPATFDTVVGQSSITGTLKNAIKNRHVAQAYLFCGPRGVGKTTCARILAKTLNCFHPTDNVEACDRCESCVSFKESRSFSIHELDAASNNSVDDIRNLIDLVRIPPQIGRYSIYIIDEVHMLSSAAFNAFLKTLEEPPAHAIFILATTEKHKIIPTILSRCQIFDFNRIKIDDIVQYLHQISDKEGVSCETDGLHIIAQKADGSMRDALSIYDQIVSYCGNHISYKSVIENLNVLDCDYYFRLTDAFLEHNVGKAFVLFGEVLDRGFDGHNFIAGLGSHFRDLLVCKDAITLPLLEVGANIREQYRKQAERCSVEFLFEALNIYSACDIGYKTSKNQRLHVELTLFQLCETGVEKKKSDPHVTVPAKAATTTTAAAAAAATTTPVQTPAVSGPIKAGQHVVPSVKTALTNSSVSGGKNAEQPAVHQETQGKHVTVTQEMLEQAWNAFSGKYQTTPRLYSLLTGHKPQLDGHVVHFTVSSSLQKDDFQKIAPELSRYLSEQFNDDHLTLYPVTTNRQEVRKPYTMEEKFEQMSRKNQALIALKQRFMLDFD
jgi:DNA polymerase-3 subunit gamma/tau